MNNVLEFDGVDDHVVITGYKGVTGTQNRTVSAWIKPSSVSGEIITWGNNSTPGNQWIVRVNETGALRAEVAGGYIYGTTLLTDGSWHHIAVVLDSDGTPDISEVLLYVDGSPETIAAVNVEPINTASDLNVTIGVYLVGSRFFQGQIDEVRIYDRALTSEELAVLAAQPGGPCSGADLTGDGFTNLPDFAALATDW